MAPDPSAVHAMEKYGNFEIVKSDKGEFGVVRLPDGTLWEAWSLYRRDHEEHLHRARKVEEHLKKHGLA